MNIRRESTQNVAIWVSATAIVRIFEIKPITSAAFFGECSKTIKFRNKSIEDKIYNILCRMDDHIYEDCQDNSLTDI
ncbi:MAG TPA: hypothetical protein VJN02_12725 [Gammaproteobacteria bacterium]|nr:hypothetical protein [Gammaproteobacteria bacterium]